MTTFVHSYISRQVLCFDHDKFETVGDLKDHLSSEKGVSKEASFLVCNGVIAKDTEPIKKDAVYHTYLRLPGGKGGFGSMLRAIGAQIEKTTNHEACRDLSGRRMRDVKNEKDLKEWLSKQSEREREREERRQERIARRRAMPNHKFDDPLYHEQRQLLAENQEDALQQGLKKSGPKPGTSATVTSEEVFGTKRKCETQGPSCSGTSKKKKDIEWLGVDVDSLSDLDSEEDNSSSTEDSARQGEATLKEEAKGHITQEDSNSGNSENNSSDSGDNSNAEAKSIENSVNSDMKIKVEFTGDGNGSNFDTVQVERVESMMSGTEIKEEEAQEEKPFILDNVTSAQELEGLGLDRLKQELLDRGLKCGGTLGERAERLYLVKGLTREQIDPSLLAKSSNGKKVKNRK